jgi:hypothetical protein
MGLMFFMLYFVGSMLAAVVSLSWREHSDRAAKIRRVNGNDPNAVLTWMILLSVLSFIGLAIMMRDINKSSKITVRIGRY